MEVGRPVTSPSGFASADAARPCRVFRNKVPDPRRRQRHSQARADSLGEGKRTWPQNQTGLARRCHSGVEVHRVIDGYVGVAHAFLRERRPAGGHRPATQHHEAPLEELTRALRSSCPAQSKQIPESLL